MFLVMAILIKTNGETKEIYPFNGHHFQFSEYYKHLNCSTVEFFDLSDGRTMVCDADSKLIEDWELNLTATELYREGRMSSEEFREYLKKLSENQKMTIIDAREDTLDCIAGAVLVGSKKEIL